MFRTVAFRIKLILVILPPLVALAALAFIVVTPKVQLANEAASSRSRAEFSSVTIRLQNQLEAEHGLTVWAVASGYDDTVLATLNGARRDTDERVAAFITASRDFTDDETIGAKVRSSLDQVGRLGALRNDVDVKRVSEGGAFDGFQAVVKDLVGLNTFVNSQATQGSVIREANALNAFVKATQHESDLRNRVVGRLAAGQFTNQDLIQINQFSNASAERIEDFQNAATPDVVAHYDTMAASAEYVKGGDLINQVITVAGTEQVPAVDAKTWWTTETARIDALNDTEGVVFGGLLSETNRLTTDSRTAATTYLFIVGAAFLLAAFAAMAVGRSIARSLRRVSDAAHDVAVVQLPHVLATLRNPSGESVVDAIPQISGDSDDEIGSLADSFNTVLRTSVETSLEHSRKRSETMTRILVSLGRRNQNLIDRQLELIDGLESTVQDQTVLEGLFRLDHMVTRMRRNAENLLVLASEQNGRMWNEPVPMSDILRSGSSEVAEMGRIELSMQPDDQTEVAGPYAVDLSHVLAELVENATAYSAPSTPVTVRGEQVDDGYRIWVIDHGLGMDEATIASVNQTLADPADIESINTDQVGFQVVARLARRLGVTVRIQSNPNGGTAVSLGVPTNVLVGGDATGASPDRSELGDEIVPTTVVTAPVPIAGALAEALGPRAELAAPLAAPPVAPAATRPTTAQPPAAPAVAPAGAPEVGVIPVAAVAPVERMVEHVATAAPAPVEERLADRLPPIPPAITPELLSDLMASADGPRASSTPPTPTLPVTAPVPPTAPLPATSVPVPVPVSSAAAPASTTASGLLKRTPGGSFSMDEHSERADAGTFRRLPTPSTPTDPLAEGNEGARRGAAMSRLSQGVEAARSVVDTPTEEPVASTSGAAAEEDAHR